MHVGIHYSPTERAMNIGELAKAIEEQGFESLFVSEHTHIPVNTPRSLRQRGPIPRAHAEGLDPWIALSMAAAVTQTIRLGTSVCLVTQHDPIVLAKQIATLDVLSGGRVVLGAGVGSVADETANHGVEPEDRWRDPAILEGYQRAGIDRVLLRVPAAAADELLPVLRRFRPLVGQFA